MFRGIPIERSHREVVILTLPNSELFLKVCEVEEFMASIEFLIVLPVAISAVHMSTPLAMPEIYVV